MRVGEKFEFNGKEWLIMSIEESGLIIAECKDRGVVPQVQPFREKNGEIARC